MGDPTRLLSASSDADELERALLTSLQTGPASDQQAAMWQKLAAQAATVAVVAGASSAAASNVAVVASGAKAHGLLAGAATLLPKALAGKLVVALAVGAAGVAGVGLWQAQGRQAPVPVVARQAARTAAPVAAPSRPAAQVVAEQVEPSLEPGQQTPASATTARPREPRASARSANSTATDALAAESRLITSARAELRSGDAAAAQATLTQLRKQFAHGVLTQEREVLQIELLALQGQATAARGRAATFVRLHPESPHSQALHRLLGHP